MPWVHFSTETSLKVYEEYFGEIDKNGDKRRVKGCWNTKAIKTTEIKGDENMNKCKKCMEEFRKDNVCVYIKLYNKLKKAKNKLIKNVRKELE